MHAEICLEIRIVNRVFQFSRYTSNPDLYQKHVLILFNKPDMLM